VPEEYAVIADSEPVGYQRTVYKELVECARDFFEGHWHELPIKIRTNPLLVASTGVGKTFLVNRLAHELGLPLFCATAGDWILLCSSLRGAPPTLPLLYEFIEKNPKGIVYLDEIEKLAHNDTTSDWSKCFQCELFSVLDRKIVSAVLKEESGPKFNLTAEKLAERFRHSMFVVAAGAWQSLWETKCDAIGFADNADKNKNPVPTHADLAMSLRLEILNRCSKPLILPPLTDRDYGSVFEELYFRLPADLQAILQRPTQEQIAEAVQSKKGFRFFEELLAVGVRALRLAKGTLSPEPANSADDNEVRHPGLFPPSPIR
jgi:hypothetical protein